MSKNSDSTKNREIPPPIVLNHHGKTLSGPMQEWQNRQQIPPVLLLTGQSGIGKRAMANYLAKWALCELKGLNGSLEKSLLPCGQCPACHQWESGNTTELIEITSENEAEDSTQSSGSLKIDQFRSLKTSAGFHTNEGRHKIILIADAERMTPQAANSVLKLLEEPPAGWIFLLTSSDPSLLLPTLVSRCQMFRLKPFSIEELQALLTEAGVPAQRRKICSEFAQGSWNRALLFAEDEIWEQRAVILEFLNEPSRVFPPLLEWASQKPSHFETLLNILEQFTAELIRWSTSQGWSSAELKADLSPYAKQTLSRLKSAEAARNFWFSRAERVAQARQESLAPLNRKLLIQDILIPWIGVHR